MKSDKKEYSNHKPKSIMTIIASNENAKDEKILEIYTKRSKLPEDLKPLSEDYVHSILHQLIYDFSLYLRKKATKLPPSEKFCLGYDLRRTVDDMLDELELYEIGKYSSHLYTVDACKRKLMRKIRCCHDSGYSAFSSRVILHCSIMLGIMGKLIGGMIAKAKEREEAKKKKK